MKRAAKQAHGFPLIHFASASCRSFVLLSVLSLCLACGTVTLSLPCAGRIYYRPGNLAIRFVVTSSNSSSVTGSTQIEGSDICQGEFSTHRDLLCCAAAAPALEVRCWNVSYKDDNPFTLKSDMPAPLADHYNLYINKDLNLLVLNADRPYVTHVTSWTQNGANSAWTALAPNAATAFNVIPQPNGVIYHLANNSNANVYRRPEIGNPMILTHLTSSAPVIALANIGRTSYAMLNTSGYPLYRWDENGAQNPGGSPAGALSSETYLLAASRVDTCALMICYNIYDVAKFVNYDGGFAPVTGNLPGYGSAKISQISFGTNDFVEIEAPTGPEPEPEPFKEVLECTAPRPSADFDCVDGVWTSKDSISTETISISSPVVVMSNFSANTLIFAGTGSSLTVNGCFNLNGSIQIVLTEQQIESLKDQKTFSLVTFETCQGADKDFSKLPLSVKGPKRKPCERIKQKLRQTESGGRKTLSAILTLDLDECNRKKRDTIIIAVSVSAFVVLIVVVIVIVALLNKGSVKSFFRPYAQRTNYN